MCKEDVRIGRKKAVLETGEKNVEAGESKQLFSNNPNRTTLVVMIPVIDVTAMASPVWVRSGGKAGAIVGVLSPYHPSVTLTVEVHGQGCTDEVWVSTDDANGATAEGTSIGWTEALNDL